MKKKILGLLTATLFAAPLMQAKAGVTLLRVVNNTGNWMAVALGDDSWGPKSLKAARMSRPHVLAPGGKVDLMKSRWDHPRDINGPLYIQFVQKPVKKVSSSTPAKSLHPKGKYYTLGEAGMNTAMVYTPRRWERTIRIIDGDADRDTEGERVPMAQQIWPKTNAEPEVIQRIRLEAEPNTPIGIIRTYTEW